MDIRKLLLSVVQTSFSAIVTRPNVWYVVQDHQTQPTSFCRALMSPLADAIVVLAATESLPFLSLRRYCYNISSTPLPSKRLKNFFARTNVIILLFPSLLF